MKKWRAVLKLEGYTTPAKEEALAREFERIVESFKGADIEIDVFLVIEGEQDRSSKERSKPPETSWKRE